MNLTSSVKRLRLTLTPNDLFRIKEAATHTLFSTKSDIIREALKLFAQLRAIHSNGARIVLRHDVEKRQYPLSLFPSSPKGQPTPPEPEAVAAIVPATEVRLPLADAAELEKLKSAGHGENQTQIVRQALKVYAEVVEKVTIGWQLVSCAAGGSSMVLPIVGGLRGGVAVNTALLTEGEVSTGGLVERTTLRDMLPQQLCDAVELVAERERATPREFVIDVLRERVSKHQIRNDLAVPPHSLEHLYAFHNRWLGESLLVWVQELRDAGPFLPILIRHLQNNVQLYYLHHDQRVLNQILEKLQRLPQDYQDEVQNYFHWIELPKKSFTDKPEFVVFDPLTPHKASGYTWHEDHGEGYDPLNDTMLENILREYGSVLGKAKQQLLSPASSPQRQPYRRIVIDPASLETHK